MKTGFILFAAVVLAVVCDAKLAEKVSEDDDFVVYRIPVRALDLQSQATGHFEGYELSPSYGRSSSKSTSHSKSSSSSTGSGRGKGYGQGGSSHGHGTGHGGSSSGQGYGSGGYGGGSGGHGSGGHGSSGHGSGYGSSGEGSGYGGGSSGQGSGYGGGSSGHGSGYGGSGSGYGGSGSGYGGSASGSGSGYGHHRGGSSYTPSYGGGSSYTPSYGGQSSYGPSYDSHGSHGSHGSHAPHYDDDEGDAPKVITTTKTVTTSSAQDTGLDKLNSYRQPSDSLGDIKFRLGDYLKNAPGHENMKYNQKFFQAAAAELAPGYRSGAQPFNVNEFTRNLNHGFTAPAYRNNRFHPQASFLIPRAYGLRHAGFGIPTF